MGVVEHGGLEKIGEDLNILYYLEFIYLFYICTSVPRIENGGLVNLTFEGACTAVHIFPTITFSVRTTIMINFITEGKWPRPKVDQALTLKQPRESLPFQLIDLDYIFGICVSVFYLKF